MYEEKIDGKIREVVMRMPGLEQLQLEDYRESVRIQDEPYRFGIDIRKALKNDEWGISRKYIEFVKERAEKRERCVRTVTKPRI